MRTMDNRKIMLHVIIEYVCGFVRDCTMDKGTWLSVVQPILEKDDAVETYRAEEIDLQAPSYLE